MQTVGTIRRGVSTRALAVALFLLAVFTVALIAGALLSARTGAALPAGPSTVQQIHQHQESERSDANPGGVSPQQLHDHAVGELP